MINTLEPAQDEALFVSLSAILTGYSGEHLTTFAVGTDLVSSYLKVWSQNVGGTVVQTVLGITQQILNTYPPAQWPEQVNQQILNVEPYGDAARQLLKMWYSGSWDSGTANSNVVSANAYVHGLMWDTIQAHPMGSSNENFGYWSELPAPAIYPKPTTQTKTSDKESQND
ncbi:MAG: hypothetical protein ACI8WB_000374 [Phenylobacterium sp.]|jgi:hypothetical protein